MSQHHQQQQQQQQQSNPLQLPTSDKDLLACRACRRIITQPQWTREGCRTCGDGRVPHAQLNEQATAHFFGHVGIVDSRKSWIARLIGVQGAPSGVYASRIARERKEDREDYDE